MKSSQMLSPSEVNNTTITHSIGTMGSVMDYPAINIALDKTKQGDFYTTKAGPYDLWAIEFGYRPFKAEEEEAGLNKILSRSTEPYLVFGNDGDDMRAPGSGIDPRINTNEVAIDRIPVISLPKVIDTPKVVEPIKVIDTPEKNVYPMPIFASSDFPVHVGRIRQSLIFGYYTKL